MCSLISIQKHGCRSVLRWRKNTLALGQEAAECHVVVQVIIAVPPSGDHQYAVGHWVALAAVAVVDIWQQGGNAHHLCLLGGLLDLDPVLVAA